jgi:hypothetical protein
MINLAKHLQVTHEILRGWHRSRKTCTACVSNSHSAHSCSLTALQRKMIKVILDEEPEDEGDEEPEEERLPPATKKSALVLRATPQAKKSRKAPAAPTPPRVVPRPLPPIASMRLTPEETDVGDLLYGPIYSSVSLRDKASPGSSGLYVNSFGRGDGERSLTRDELLSDGLHLKATVRLVDSFPFMLVLIVGKGLDGTRSALQIKCGPNVPSKAMASNAAAAAAAAAAASEPSATDITLSPNDKAWHVLTRLGALGALGGDVKQHKESGGLEGYVESSIEVAQPDFSLARVTSLAAQAVEAATGGRKRRQAEVFQPPDHLAEAQQRSVRKHLPGGMPLASAPGAQLTPPRARTKRVAAREVSAAAEGADYAGDAADGDYGCGDGATHGKQQRKKPRRRWQSERDELCSALMRWFDIDDFHVDTDEAEGRWQRRIVEAVLGGRDAVVFRPTGSGKSLCFQLPAIVDALRVTKARSGEGRGNSSSAASGSGSSAASLPEYKTTIVIMPTVSLMKDQTERLNTMLAACARKEKDGLAELGIASGRTNAVALLGTGQNDKSVADDVRAGHYRIVCMSEQLLFGDGTLKQGGTSWMDDLARLHQAGRLLHVAIDEAHCMIQYPESDFRRSYARLGELRTRMPGLPIMALSAVAPPAIWPAIRERLGLRSDAEETRGSVYRPNLIISFRAKVPSGDGKFKHCFKPFADEMLEELRTTGHVSRTLVYVYKKKGERVQTRLRALRPRQWRLNSSCVRVCVCTPLLPCPLLP